MVEQTIAKSATRLTGASAKTKRGFPKILKKAVTVILLIIAVGGVLYWLISKSEAGINQYPKNKWQAVFLSNGQVYFGHVTKVAKKSVVLEDIYYLQVVVQPLQRSQEGMEAASQPAQQEQRLTLIKLGNEIHAPYDRMNINREHVILIENLKDNSRVVEAITRYISEQQQPAAGQ